MSEELKVPSIDNTAGYDVEIRMMRDCVEYLMKKQNLRECRFGVLSERIEAVESHPALSVPPLETPEKSLLRNCPHCGGDHRDLSVERMVFDEFTGEDTSATREFVYCECCGHYGDLDTWNERAEGEKVSGESYPERYKHCMIHLDPENGEMHSDGDHSVREWIQDRIKETAK